VILFCVQYPKYYDASPNDLLEHFVGKSTKQASAEIPIIQARLFGSVFQRSNGNGDLVEKFISQPGSALFIPGTGSCEILLGRRPNQDQTVHERRGSLASTSDQGAPAVGLVS
jgi:hypothetical protein